jgi:Family of unknown function (DUF6788)
MKPRSQRPVQERNIRSRAVRRVANEPLLRGSLVQMHRTCGKEGCHCQQGEKHPALYLSLRDQGKRCLVYIPPALEETVRAWVQNARDVDELLDLISAHSYQELLQKKTHVLGSSRKSRRTTPKKRPSP